MKKKLFLIMLSVCTALCLGSNAFADIDLDLGDDSGISDSPLSRGFVTIKGGYDMSGSAEMDYEAKITQTAAGYEPYSESASDDEEVDVDSGFSLSLELGKGLHESIAAGVGATYQLNRGIDESGAKSEFQFIPIYGFAKFWTDAGDFIPFGTIQIGYNFFRGNDELKNMEGMLGSEELDLSGGLYWGIGGGIILANGVQFELLYSVHSGSGSFEDTETYYDPYYDIYFDEKVTLDVNVKYSKITLSVGINL